VISDATEPQIHALRTYGDALGTAFQIADDLLDYGGDASATGKNLGDDFRERKLTLPVIKAIAKADADERAFWKRTIEKGDQRDGDLDEALRLIARHRTMETTRAEALEWSARARSALTVLPEHPLRDMLTDLAEYVVARIN
jgi:octaprenyl-diphosphate synthase